MKKLFHPFGWPGLLILSGLLLLFGVGFVATEGFTNFDCLIKQNSQTLMNEGQQTLRFDTFGDEAFWGGTLQLHQAIEGEKFGGDRLLPGGPGAG